MKKKYTIELTQKEAFILWSVITWFERPIAYHTLKARLANIVFKDQKAKQRLMKAFEVPILKRIVNIGEWVTKRHPEFLEEKPSLASQKPVSEQNKYRKRKSEYERG